MSKILKALGIPGPEPTNDAEVELKKEAEQFIAQIEDDIDAFDAANAEAIESYVNNSRIGRWLFRKSSDESISAAASTTEASPTAGASSTAAAEVAGAAAAATTTAAAAAAAAAAQVSGSSRSSTAAKSSTVTRMRATELDGNSTPPTGKPQAAAAAAGAPRPQQSKSTSWAKKYFFRKYNPEKPPILERRFIPYMCVALFALTWTPDTWKLRGLYLCDSYYAQFRRSVHTAYWKMTMDPEEFVALMEQMEANLPRSKRTVKGTDCPM